MPQSNCCVEYVLNNEDEVSIGVLVSELIGNKLLLTVFLLSCSCLTHRSFLIPPFVLNAQLKSVQIRSYFWSVFSCIRTEYGGLLVFSPNEGKYGPEITPYLDTSRSDG